MMFHALNRIGWRGAVEFDCHMLRAEGNPADEIGCRKQFIVDSVTALSMALKLAERIELPGASVSQSAADLASIRQMCALGDVDPRR